MPATSFVKVGIIGAVYRNTGTFGTPVWTEITLVRDAQVPIPWDLVEASARHTRVKIYAPTQMDFAVSVNVRKDDLDAGVNALWDATVGADMLDLLILDGKITVEGSRGIRAHFYSSLTAEDQSIGAAVFDTFDLRPGYHTDGNPKIVKVGAASALTLTDPG